MPKATCWRSASYTARTWGLKQAEKYLFALESHFEAICVGTVPTRQPLPHRPEFFSSRCQHHCVFFTREDDGSVIILAILHENMDLIARLRERLG